MTPSLDETHDESLRSWVQHTDGTDFPIQNLPLGCARSFAGETHPCIAIENETLDLTVAGTLGYLDAETVSLIAACVEFGSLNPLLGAGRSALGRLRAQVSLLLRTDTAEGRSAQSRARDLLTPLRTVTLVVPAKIGDFTDFYASIHHATNVGSMFRPDNALLPNYKWVPIGYHGRASSIVVSGAEVYRPSGQTRDDPAAPPTFGPTRRLDYELEVGAIIGRGNALGTAITTSEAERHLAGFCLVNDWSARDIQAWEYQPLGPFLSKSFATSISPWIITLDALAPFRVPARPRDNDDPAPLPYLFDENDQQSGGLDIELEVLISSARMRAEGRPLFQLSRGNFASIYWTFSQLVGHHTSNGCNLTPGDLIASGTVSGAAPSSRGCLLERTWRGTEPIALPGGESRQFLEDGDEVIMRGWCERAGYQRIGFGECRGTVAAR